MRGYVQRGGGADDISVKAKEALLKALLEEKRSEKKQ